MKQYFTSLIATISTLTPELEKFNPELITEGSSLVVQIVTAIIAIISFFKTKIIKNGSSNK